MKGKRTRRAYIHTPLYSSGRHSLKMNFTLLRTPPTTTTALFTSSTISYSLNSRFSKPNSIKPPSSILSIPARDRVIDFGKYRGKMLGTLPSTYLKWVSENLRARNFEHWAVLADQVLEDPVYNDRIEWEFAASLLNGNISSSAARSDRGVTKELQELSERFGWDNEDKAGWGKVDFDLLGTSKGGRIPRISDRKVSGMGGNNEGTSVVELRKKETVRGKRDERRERIKSKLKRDDEDRLGNSGKTEGIYGNIKLEEKQRDDVDDQVVDPTVGKQVVYNPFPGRQSLLKKVLNRRRPL